MALPPITPYVVGLPYPLQEFIRQVRQALSGVAGIASISSSNISGVVDGSDAALGVLGEYKTANLASGSAITLSNGVAANIISVSLAAGDWDIWGLVQLSCTGAVTSQMSGSVSSTSATNPTNSAFITPIISAGLTGFFQEQAPVQRMNFATTTTVYLVTTCLFSGGAITAFGSIYARRMR